MRNSIRLGRILGIPVGINWSLLVIAGLLTVGLAGGQFPAEFPGYAPAAYWVVGAITAGLFFAGVLAHELSHAVVAGRNGTQVRGITLWLLGGVAQLDANPSSPGAEFRIAAAGPAMSLGLAGLYAVLASAVSALGLPGLLGSALGWLAFINVLLAVFNLLPAAPLDGGRLLTAALWARSHDQNRAIATASQVGVVLGWGLVGFGALGWLTGLAYGGLWTALIGWFIVNAARQEGAIARARMSLGDLRVRDAMGPVPPRARGWLTVDGFMHEDAPLLHDTVVPVERFDGAVAGLVNVNQLRSVSPFERTARRVQDYALPLAMIRTAQTDERLADVMLRPARGPLDHILVFEGERLVGMVTPADLERVRARPSTPAPTG
jgi:Zn-dependent protease